MRSKNRVSLAGLLVAAALAASNFGCGGGQAAPPIAVSISPVAATVQAGATQQFTATVSNDPSNGRVAWSVSCSGMVCGAVSPRTTASGVPTTYKFPNSVPQANVIVTVTATSVTDTSKSASASVEIPAITITLNPSTANLQAGGTQQFTAAVSNDAPNGGVAWSVSCPTAPCGKVLPSTTPSGAATTYTAPSTTPLSGLTVTVTATSVTDTSKSATASVTLPAVTVTVSPSTANLQAGATQQFTATVSNDPTNSGVAWTLAKAGNACSPGCGTISSTSAASGGPITYTAPATPPSSNLTLTLTATSVALNSASASATVTVLAIAVSVTPISALLPGGTTQEFTATVSNDPTHSGVTLALTESGTVCAATACGTLSSTTTSPVIYTAPATVSAAAKVALTATSVADTTKSAAAAVMLTTGTLKIVPYSLDFGTAPTFRTKPPRSTMLTNVGATALSITSIDITGRGSVAFSIQSNNCGTSLPPLSSCTIAVTFTPEGKTGSFSADVSVTDSSADSPQQVSLSGTADPGTNKAEVRSVLAGSPVVVAPGPRGANLVGTRVTDLIDSSRDDPYLTSGAKRELLVRFWYPASLSQGCQPALYTSPAVWNYYSKLLGVHLPEVRTNACQDAPVADGVYPLVVFTPGFTATFTDYTFIFEDLASRGYVVASVDHTYEATAVQFPDGRFIRSIFGSHLVNSRRIDSGALMFAVSVRLGDLESVLNDLGRLNIEAGSPFAGKLDMTRIALAGHSLGGLTAILGVEKEPRFSVAINIDGGVPDGLVTPTATPVLILAAGRERWSDSDRQLWDNLRGPRFAVNLKGSEHVTPSDAVWLAKGAIKAGAMGLDKTVAAVRDYIAAFLNTYLRGAPKDPLLTGAFVFYPDAAVTLQDELLGAKP